MSRFPSLFVLALAITAALPAQALQPPAAISIGQVQGRSDRSAFDGRQVTVEAMVTADMRPGLGGIFVQDAGDGDPQTSDGLFVEVGPDLDLRPGQWLRIRGTVQSQGESVRARVTTLRDVQLQPLPARPAPPVTVLTGIPASWQALQGMQVRIEAPLTLSGQDQLGRYGELTVSFGGRLWQPSEVAVPGSSAYAEVVADNQRRRLRLDDGSTKRDPARVSYLPEAATLRTGMQLSGVQGIVDRRFDEGYRLQMTAPLTLPALQRPTVPTVPGAVRIAAFNLENFFNGDGRGGGFPTPRGAKSLAQFQAQEAKLVSTIRSLDADVAALMELENDGYGADSSIAHLVAALNAGQGKAGDWTFVDAGIGPGDNAIRVGIIYRSSRLTPIGRPAVLEQEPFGQRSRVPLAQAFRGKKGKPFVVVANHFKSKGCSEASGADVDQNDGQACWNATRTESARQLHQWLQGDPTRSGARDTVLLGDFNAYAKEDPIRQLEADGWRDAFAVAGVAHPYSYVYNGLSGRLDHALLNAGMARRLRGAVEWHINADEADDVGYHARNVPGPWRSSDHDPLLLGFSF